MLSNYNYTGSFNSSENIIYYCFDQLSNDDMSSIFLIRTLLILGWFLSLLVVYVIVCKCGYLFITQ